MLGSLVSPDTHTHHHRRQSRSIRGVAPQAFARDAHITHFVLSTDKYLYAYGAYGARQEHHGTLFPMMSTELVEEDSESSDPQERRKKRGGGRLKKEQWWRRFEMDVA
jgi:hypothetical protein